MRVKESSIIFALVTHILKVDIDLFGNVTKSGELKDFWNRFRMA